MPVDEITTVAGSHLRGFRGVAGESRLRPRLVAEDCTTRYYLRCRTDGYVERVLVMNPVGEIACFTQVGNTHHHWGCKDAGSGIIEFFPHPEYQHVKPCVDCHGAKVVGVSETNPMGSRCQNCEGSGSIPAPVCLVFEPHVVAERIYLEPTTIYSFAGA